MNAPPSRAPRPEHWRHDAGPADVAVLDVPASLDRRRVFDIDVRFVVRAPSTVPGAWHAMRVELDGREVWSRRSRTHNPDESDSLDYHCRRELGVGEALRVRAVTQVAGSHRVGLTLDAEESS